MAENYVQLQTPNYIFGSDNLNDEYDPMNDNYISIHHRVLVEFQNIDWDDITDAIREVAFEETIDSETHQKLQQERQLLLSIRQKLETFQNTLRVSYRGHVYQSFKVHDFQQQSNTYITNRAVYFFVHQLKDIQNPEIITQQCLATIVNRIEATLDDLYRSNCLNAVQFEMMFVKRTRVQFNYLYFVPDYDKVCRIIDKRETSQFLHFLFYVQRKRQLYFDHLLFVITGQPHRLLIIFQNYSGICLIAIQAVRTLSKELMLSKN